jgi:hypothetical protein
MIGKISRRGYQSGDIWAEISGRRYLGGDIKWRCQVEMSGGDVGVEIRMPVLP